MSIAITGAAGQLGRLVADRVLQATADPADVVLITRDPSKLADLAAATGAEVRRGDFDDVTTLPSAFAGVTTLLLISTDRIGDRVPQQLAAVAAAVEAGVRHIAYTSITNPSDSNPIVVAAEHRATEEAIRASGAAWTFLRNSIYADMVVQQAGGALATGRLITNAGSGGVSYVTREDCAAAAAAVLTSGDAHAGRTYDITGPEAPTPADLAQLIGTVGGKPVELVLVDDEAAARGMVEHAGLPEPLARGLATFGTGARLGYSAAVSTAVADLTGTRPTPLRDVLTTALSASDRQAA